MLDRVGVASAFAAKAGVEKRATNSRPQVASPVNNCFMANYLKVMKLTCLMVGPLEKHVHLLSYLSMP